MHDYKFEWDYDVYYIRGKKKALVDGIAMAIRRRLIKRIDLFEDFKIGFVKNRNFMGCYVDGTSEYPHIGLNMAVIEQACKDCKLPVEEGIATTILHELAHAIQDYCGICYNENEAEDFCFYFYNFNKVLNFWEPIKTKKGYFKRFINHKDIRKKV